MIELKHSLVSEQAIINSLTGQLSVINLINGITLPSLPQEVNTLFLVMSWQRDREEKAEEVNFDIRIFLEHDNEIVNSDRIFNMQLTIPKDEYIINTVTNLGIKFTKPNENRLIIEKKTQDEWERLGSVSIEVTVMKDAQGK